MGVDKTNQAFGKRLDELASLTVLSVEEINAVIAEARCSEYEAKVALLKTAECGKLSVDKAVEYIHAKSY